MALEKNIKLKVTADTKQADQEFDKVEVSVKDLQERISYLAVEMKKLEQNFGKSGLASKEYAMYQRELKFATEQLINTEEKVNEKTKTTARGLGSLGSASIAALGSVSGLGTGISVLTNSLMAGAGLSAGLAGVTIAFSLLMETVRNANEETEKFNKTVKGLIDVELPGGGFKIAPENLDNTIAYLESLIEQQKLLFKQTISSGGVLMGTVPKDDKLLATLKSTKKALEEINKEYKVQKQVIDSLNSAGLFYTEDDITEKKTKSVKKLTESWKLAEKSVDAYIKKLTEALEKQLAGEEKMSKERNRITNSLGITKKEGNKPGVGFTENEVMQDFYNENSFFIEQMRGDLSILQGEFNNFWTNTFGEANSLLEKFLQNFANGLLELASQSLISGILNFLLPGAGTLADHALKSQTIVVQLGNEELARAVVKGNYEAQRLRLN